MRDKYIALAEENRQLQEKFRKARTETIGPHNQHYPGWVDDDANQGQGKGKGKA